MTNQFAYLYLSLRDLAEPLLESFSSPEEVEYLFYRYGWQILLDEAVFGKINQGLGIKTALEQFLLTAGSLQQQLDENPDSSLSVQDVAKLAEAADTLIGALAELKLPSLTEFAPPLGDQEFWASIGDHLFDDLLEEYLRIYHPSIYLVLHFSGVIRYEPTQPDAPFRRPYTEIVFDWDQMVAMVQNPLTALKQTYKWGDPTKPFEYQRLFAAAEKVLRAIHLPTSRFAPGLLANTDFPAGSVHRIQNDVDALRTILLYDYSVRDQTVYEIGLELLAAAKTEEAVPSGLMLRPILRGGAAGELPLGQSLALRWNVAASAADVVGLALFPDTIDLTGGQPTLGASLEVVDTRTEPWYLFGNQRTARIELYSPSIRLSIEGAADDAEARLQLRATAVNGQPGCKVVVPLDEADGFVKETVNKQALEFSFSPEVIWSSETGLTFNGKPKVDLDLPVNISIGKVHV